MRWKGFITLFVIFALGTVVCAFFLDDIIEISIEKAGTAVWGAKVELDDVHISWSPLGIELSGFTVASKKEEFRNLIDIENMKFAILTAPLFEKKINIKEISGEGLAFNTQRDISGFLPKEKKEKREKTERKWKGKISSWLENVKQQAKEKINVADAFNKDELKTLKAVEEIRTSLTVTQEKYKDFKGLDAESKIRAITASIESLKKITVKDEKDIATAKKKIEDANKAIKEADKFVKEVNKTMTEVKYSASLLQGQFKKIDKIRREDYKNLMDKLKLPSLEMDEIAKVLFGSLVVEKFNTVISYVEKIRKHIPPKKEKEKVVKKPRAKGTDMIFVREKMYPPLLIKKALISGEENAMIKLSGFTTTPAIYGSPMIISATYKDMNLSVKIDRTRDIPTETINISKKKFNIANSTGSIRLSSEFSGDNIEGNINWKGRGILPRNLLDYLRLEDPLITVIVKITGERSDPKFSIKSNIDKIISDKLKKELAEKLNEAKKKIKNLIDKEVAGQVQKLKTDINSFKKEKLAMLDREKQKVENKKAELEEKIVAKEKEIKDTLRKKAKEVENKLKKDAEEKLKKFFK